MTDIILQKLWNSFVPVDDEGDAFLAKQKHRGLIRCQITKPRNLAFHRKFFALVNFVAENSDYDTKEQFLHVLKVRMGWCDFVADGSGGLVAVPKSISFAKMDNDDFNKFYSQAIDTILKDFLDGANREELEMHVLGFSG